MASANFEVPDDVCPSDPVVLAQLSTGSTMPDVGGCRGELSPDWNAPIAPYGSTASAYGSTCTVKTDGVRCRNVAGGFFHLNREHFKWSDDGQ